jgi:NADH-quinone oxidoreductase subunit N
MTALIILSLLGIVVLMMGLFKLKNSVLILIIPVLIATLFLNSQEWATDNYYFSKMVHFDHFALSFSSLLILVTTLIFGICSQHYKSSDKSVEDIYALLIFSLVGGICMVSYNNLIMFIMGIEILSIPLYVLAGSNRDSVISNEASLKYFLMGAFASAFILFGMALVFGATNSFQLDDIRASVSNSQMPGVLHTGILLMIGGILFKAAVAPFHFWAPDVYQGSPSVITSFMATVVKTAAFAGLFRLLFAAFQDISGMWVSILVLVSVASLIIGNLSAMSQTDFKRLMAFSGISHAGYMLIAIIVLKIDSADALFFYATSYCLASLTAFAVFLSLQNSTGEYSLEILKGLSRKNPFMAFALVVAFLSLAGIPPLAGFFGKYFLFITAIKNGFLYLVIIAIINTMIGAYYYLRVLNLAFTKEVFYEKPIKNSILFDAVIVFTAIGSIILGVFPDLLKGLI